MCDGGEGEAEGEDGYGSAARWMMHALHRRAMCTAQCNRSMSTHAKLRSELKGRLKKVRAAGCQQPIFQRRKAEEVL